MNLKKLLILEIFGITLLFVLCFASALLLPWEQINWGGVTLTPQKTITVTGEATADQKNEVARFSAGVSTINDSKEVAIAEANEQTKQIITAVKNFGVKSEDIQTQNLSVYQGEEIYYEGDRQKSRPGQWRVSNTVEIILRDAARTSDLADLLGKTGATNVYGPNFTSGDSQTTEAALLGKAIENAKQKAAAAAKNSGKTLGSIINITEGGATSGVFPEIGINAGGGGAPTEAGTSKVRKSVTVTFELK